MSVLQGCSLAAMLVCVAWNLGPADLLVESAFAQELDEALEDLAEAADGLIAPPDMARLDELRHSPIDLNTATRTELEQLPWMTPQQAEDVVRRRNRSRSFPAVSLLPDVPGLDRALVEGLRPFVSVRAPPRLSGRWRMTGQRRERDMGRRTGWMGLRTDITIGPHVLWGARVDHRRLSRAETRGMTGYAGVRDWGLIEQFLIGRYRIEYGQGLVLGERSSGTGVSGVGVPFKWRPRGVTPVRSSPQSGQLHGAVMVARLRALRVTTAVARSQTQRSLTGFRVSWMHDGTSAGLTFARRGKAPSGRPSDASGADDEAEPAETPLSPALVYGLDLDAMIGPTNLYGEIARSDEGMRFVAGVLWTLGRLDGGTVAQRRDESNITTDVRFRPDDQTILAFSHRTTRRRWNLTDESIPAMGTVVAARIMRRITRSVVMTAMWRGERREEGKPVRRRYDPARLRGQVDWNVTPRLRLRGRAEHQVAFSSTRKAEERERVFLADVRYQTMGKLSLSGRWVGSSGVTTQALRYESDDPFDPVSGYSLTDDRASWSVFMRGPIAAKTELSVRYTQRRVRQAGKTIPQRSDVVWTVQVDAAW